jgi:hypothetical protein
MKRVFKKVFVPHTQTNPTPLFWHPVSIILFILCTISVGITVFFTAPISLKPHSFLGDIKTGVIIAFTNEERQKENIPELIENPVLAEAATLKAEDMAQKGYFAHYSPEGISPWFWFSQKGYVYEKAGENLAVLFNDSKQVVNAWMNSPSHRANILKEGYTEIGIGTAEGIYKGKSTTFVVQFFAKPKDSTGVTLFAFETQNPETSQLANVQGLETTNFSLETLFGKDYILFTILFLASSILLVTALISLVVFFVKHSHNTVILRTYVACVTISAIILIYLYIVVFQNINILSL